MDSLRKTALVAGLFYLATFVSIPTLALYPAVRDPAFVVTPGPATGVLVGALLEVIVGVACIGTAITLYPVVKRQNEAVAMGFVAARVLEAALIFVGVASLLTLVALKQDGAGVTMIPVGRALAELYDAVFLVSQGFVPGLNALLLGTLLYRSGLVPRVIPAIGLVGAPLFLAAKIAAILGLVAPQSVLPALTTLPIAVWELSLGLWLTFRGFRPSPITAGTDGVGAMPAPRASMEP